MTLSPTIAITGFSSSNSRSLTADSKWGAFLSLTLAFSDSHSEDAFFVHANPLLFLLVAYSSIDTNRLPNVEPYYPHPIETFVPIAHLPRRADEGRLFLYQKTSSLLHEKEGDHK